MVERNLCNFNHCPTLHYTSHIEGPVPMIVRMRRTRFQFLQCLAPWLAPHVRKKKKKNVRKGPSKANPAVSSSSIQPGDIVEVRSFDEISRTLNDKGRSKGLFFMPEQKLYCGQRFKVYKKPQRLLMELTGEMREMTSPSFYLEGVYCNGQFHRGCERSCFLIWREEWLSRVPPE